MTTNDEVADSHDEFATTSEAVAKMIEQLYGIMEERGRAQLDEERKWIRRYNLNPNAGERE